MSLLSIGCLVGAFVSGGFSDIVGRIPVLIFGTSLVAVSGIVHTAAMNLWYVSCVWVICDILVTGWCC